MTDQITKLLDDVQRLDERATQGPWEATGNDYGGKVYEPSGYPLPGCTSCGENEATYQGQDAEFIALSRTALPELAEAVRAVMELHRQTTQSVPVPVFDEYDDPVQIQNLCAACNSFWPCKTVQAITAVLEVTGVV